ncbi:MAG TPA: phosphotransferase, partial [Parvularculaceae bacterium]|nr:phosphotransferase [Parvularculaceae bacterium]
VGRADHSMAEHQRPQREGQAQHTPEKEQGDAVHHPGHRQRRQAQRVEQIAPRELPARDDQRTDYLAAWRPILKKLTPPSLMVLRDFHAENLLWLPDRDGFRRAGIIDFQDGLVGNPAYDLVSLLEDARRDVSPALANAMIERYAAGAAAIGDFDEGAFRRDYAILGAQRNAKILGIFARLINRDKKPRYQDFIPRVEAHFRGDLAHPDLAPVAAYFKKHFGDRF